jgi:hypothetical protein
MTRIPIDLSKPEKFKEVILYVSQKCETDPRFSVTKLNKILFFSDFISFGRTGKSITEQNYQRLDFGPAPRAMVPVCTDMTERGDLAIVPRPYFNQTQKKPLALRDPDLSALSSSEVALIDEIIEKVWNLTASQISAVSHGFIGWQIAKPGETIPYGLAWIDTEPEFSLEEIEEISALNPLSDEEKQNLNPRALA